MTDTSAPPTRRGLLKTLTALGVLGMTGAAPALTPAPMVRRLRVAVIVPRHSRYPGLSAQFQRGLEAALKDQPAQLTFFPTGPLPREAQATARTALETAPDLLVVLGDGLAEELRSLLHAHAVPVLAAELGARRPGAAPLPLTLTLSLHAWEAERAHGEYLARSGTRRLHLLLSHHDAGYDLSYAFSSGYVGAGGILSGTTLFDDVQPATAALLAEVQRSGARAVHILASGAGAEVMKAFQRSGLQVTIGGLTAPGERHRAPAALAALPEAPAQARLGTADPIAVLGYDAGRWLTAALIQLPAGQPVNALTLHAALTHAPVQGARGLLQADARGLLRAPLWLSRTGQSGVPLAASARTEGQSADGLRSGWLQTYLYT